MISTILVIEKLYDKMLGALVHSIEIFEPTPWFY